MRADNSVLEHALKYYKERNNLNYFPVIHSETRYNIIITKKYSIIK